MILSDADFIFCFNGGKIKPNHRLVQHPRHRINKDRSVIDNNHRCICSRYGQAFLPLALRWGYISSTFAPAWLWSVQHTNWDVILLDSPLGAGRATLSWCWWPPLGKSPSSCCVSFLYPGHRRLPCLVKPHCCPGRHLSHDKKQEETVKIRRTLCLLPAFAVLLCSKGINKISKEF